MADDIIAKEIPSSPIIEDTTPPPVPTVRHMPQQLEVNTVLDSHDQLNILASGENLHAQQMMQQARDFFVIMGIPFDENGLVAESLSEEQLQQLRTWKDQTFTNGLEMPTEDIFYKKVLLAVSLWRQRGAEGIQYLLGKGVGLETALQGQVRGRVKNPVQFSYRTHSDFELYGVNVAEGTTNPYSPQFHKVLGSQEYFDLTRTKGLHNLPPELLHETAEVVDLGGVEVLVPELELLFLDKWEKSGVFSRPEGSDAELLARQYDLDRTKVHDYLDRFVIGPEISLIQATSVKSQASQLAAVRRNLQWARRELESEGAPTTHAACVERVNQKIAQMLNTRGSRDITVGGIQSNLWIELRPDQIDEEGNIIDEELLRLIAERVQSVEQTKIEIERSKHQQLDELFSSIAGTEDSQANDSNE